MLEALTVEEVKPIREIIYLQLRDAIISGDIKDGERLIETEVAERLKVSRTPVREAIRMLESESLIESLPRRGAIVRGVKMEDIVEIYKIRQALEVIALQSAAEHITAPELAKAELCLKNSKKHLEEKNYAVYYQDNEQFTEGLIRAGRMPRTTALIATYRDQLRSYRRITLSSALRQQIVIHEHTEILKAVEKRDVELVGRLVFIHLQGALEECRKYLAASAV